MCKHHQQGVSLYTKVTKFTKVRSTVIYIDVIKRDHKIKTLHNITQQAGYSS